MNIFCANFFCQKITNPSKKHIKGMQNKCAQKGTRKLLVKLKSVLLTRWKGFLIMRKKVKKFFNHYIIYSSGFQPFSVRVPPNRYYETHIAPVSRYDIFTRNVSVNLKLMKIKRAPRDFSRAPGWEPLICSTLSIKNKIINF